MNVGLIQVDGTLPNLALMKLSAYHKSKGDSVTIMRSKEPSTRLVEFDKVYVSCIFDENRETALKVAKQFKNSVIGGIGVNSEKLPDEIEHLMPDYEGWNCDYSLGFTTRGCIRKCYFCKVPAHEGVIKENCDIYEFWDKKHKQIVLLDNNILALPNHFKKIASQLLDNNLGIDFNQGLDHRLLTPELCSILLSLKHSAEIRFAFDDISYTPSVIKALEMLKEAGMRDGGSRWYLYIGEKDTFETAYERMKILHEYKQAVYVMRDKKVYDNPDYIALASWGNTMGAFKVAELKDLLLKSERLRPYKSVFDKHFGNRSENKVLGDF